VPPFQIPIQPSLRTCDDRLTMFLSHVSGIKVEYPDEKRPEKNQLHTTPLDACYDSVVDEPQLS
jgi:hypothetical protein